MNVVDDLLERYPASKLALVALDAKGRRRDWHFGEMTARSAGLHHLNLASRPSASMVDRLTWSWVLRLSRLEEVKDVLRARCRPQGEELVIRIGECPTAADRHETRVANFREDHSQHPSCSHLPN